MTIHCGLRCSIMLRAVMSCSASLVQRSTIIAAQASDAMRGNSNKTSQEAATTLTQGGSDLVPDLLAPVFGGEFAVERAL